MTPREKILVEYAIAISLYGVDSPEATELFNANPTYQEFFPDVVYAWTVIRDMRKGK
jgi:hypothetical protein